MSSQLIGMQQNTLDLPLSEITRKEKYTFTCWDTYQTHYSDLTIQNQRKSRTRHTHMSSPNMELKYNMYQTPTLPPPSTKRRPNIYRQLQEPSFIVDGRSIILFSPHSVQSQPNKCNQQKKQRNNSTTVRLLRDTRKGNHNLLSK